MPRIKIKRDKCKSCLLCVGVCPKKVIIADSKLNKLGVKPVKVSEKDSENCLGCMMCVIICPDCCIEIEK